MKKRLALSLFWLVIGLSALAQNSTQGKEFWISFMQNGYKNYDSQFPDWVKNSVMVSAKRACTGTIRKARNSMPYDTLNFSVEDNGIAIVEIPESWAYNEGNEEIVGSKAIVLTATDTVSVFISNVANYSFDASFVLPVECLGSEYIIQTDQQSISDNFNSRLKETSAFLIVAIEDDTEVEIMPSVTTLKGHGAGVPYTVTLSAGQTYSVRSNNTTDWRDFSGTTVCALNGKKIAVFNGNTITRIPGEARNGRDHIFEQALPVDSWGRRFVVTSSSGRVRDVVKVTSSADDNVIFRDGEEIAIIGNGDSFEFDLFAEDGSCFIETSEPSIVYLYQMSCQDPYMPSGAQYGDPSMVWIPPIEQCIREVTFCTFNDNHTFGFIPDHFVNIVVGRADISKVRFDGVLIDAAEFQQVRGSEDFFFVRKSIDHGTHHLLCESGMNAHVYGFGDARGYAYCVGSYVQSINSKLYVNGKWSGWYRDGLYFCEEGDAHLQVVANFAIDQVDWDFDDGQTAQGIETSHHYGQAGDYLASAYVKGFNAMTMETIEDTLSIAIHVGEPFVSELILSGCDSIVYEGEVFHQSIHREFHGINIFGCDSSLYLTVNIAGASPSFEICGNHWPIGGSEAHISTNEYSIQLDNPQAGVDTVIWQVDYPLWLLEPHGKGETCTLTIYNFLLEPVMLRATAINPCDTIIEEFFIQTSYHGVGEEAENQCFDVFPNPSNGSVTLRFGDLTGWAQIEVYNGFGQKADVVEVDVTDCKKITYNISHLQDGVYFFVMRNQGRVLTRKVALVR